MALTTLIAFLQEAPAASDGANTTVKIVSGVLALVLVGVIIMRRKSVGKKKEDDEF